jgi:hypothetical protein
LINSILARPQNIKYFKNYFKRKQQLPNQSRIIFVEERIIFSVFFAISISAISASTSSASTSSASTTLPLSLCLYQLCLYRRALYHLSGGRESGDPENNDLDEITAENFDHLLDQFRDFNIYIYLNKDSWTQICEFWKLNKNKSDALYFISEMKKALYSYQIHEINFILRNERGITSGK